MRWKHQGLRNFAMKISTIEKMSAFGAHKTPYVNAYKFSRSNEAKINNNNNNNNCLTYQSNTRPPTQTPYFIAFAPLCLSKP